VVFGLSEEYHIGRLSVAQKAGLRINIVRCGGVKDSGDNCEGIGFALEEVPEVRPPVMNNLGRL
jgi:hypothetical protein